MQIKFIAPCHPNNIYIYYIYIYIIYIYIFFYVNPNIVQTLLQLAFPSQILRLQST